MQPALQPPSGRQQPGNSVGPLRLLSSASKLTHKERHGESVICCGSLCVCIFFSLEFCFSLLFSFPVLVFALVRVSLQNMPCYSSTVVYISSC